MSKLIFERNVSFRITLHQINHDRFRVTYGFQSWEGDYAEAAKRLGEALMHDLACEGKLDASEDAIEAAITRAHQ